jgi:capsular polysaccharide biosynthesis protein
VTVESEERSTEIVAPAKAKAMPALDTATELDFFQPTAATVVPRTTHTNGVRPTADRMTAIWRAKYLIVAATVLVGALVYAVSNSVTPVYSSSAIVSVTAASTPGGSAQDVALASNDLAAQDAQSITADGVLAQASKALGVPTSTLSSHLSAGTVNAQNIVQITVQASDPATAERWVNELAVAFKAYLGQSAQANSTALQNSVAAQEAPITQQITALQRVIAAAPPAAAGSEALSQVQSEESQLTELIGTRATLQENTALAIASQQPNIDIVQTASSATKVSPRPTLYAAIAAVATLLATCQIATVVARRRSWLCSAWVRRVSWLTRCSISTPPSSGPSPWAARSSLSCCSSSSGLRPGSPG